MAILMDLSKASDCLPHNLLIAKLKAYGLSKRQSNSLKVTSVTDLNRSDWAHVQVLWKN